MMNVPITSVRQAHAVIKTADYSKPKSYAMTLSFCTFMNMIFGLLPLTEN